MLVVRLLVVACALATAAGCVRLVPLAELRAEAGTDDWITVDGHRVHAVVRGRGEPVLLLHGFGGSVYSWREVLPELARRHRVVAIDLYGFGWTDRPETLEPYARDGQVQLALGALDALGIDRAHVMGHSYGGALAMTLAATRPERVRSLVLVDAAAPEYPNRRRKWVAAVPGLPWLFVRGIGLREPFVRRVLRHSYADPAALDEATLDAYRERLRARGAVTAWRGLTAPYDRLVDRRPVRYEELDLPVLVVWGERDRLVPLEDGKEAASALPRHRFVEIAGVGHAPMEEAPREFLDAVLPFLEDPEEVSGPAAPAAARPSD